MNKLIRNLLISASLATATQAAPFLAIGDGAELFVTGVVGIRGDDNILLGSGVPEVRDPATNRIIQAKSPDVDDLIFDFNPGLELTFGKNAQFQGALTAVESISRYSDRNYLDTELFSTNFTAQYDDGKTKYGVNAGYNQLNQNTVDVRGLIRRDVWHVGGNSEVGLTEKMALGVGGRFVSEDYKRENYNDNETLTIPVNFYYKVTPKVDVSAGYQFRNYDTFGTVLDARDHFLSVGARGNFTPKLTGRFAVGVTQRRFEAFGNKSMFGMDASLAYELTEKSALQFGATNGFDTSPTGGQQKNFVLNGSFTSKISEEWAFTAGASWRNINYYFGDSRTDDYLEGNLGVTYIINANVKILANYVYRTYETEVTANEFYNNVFSVAASFRY